MSQIRLDPVRFLAASQIIGRVLKENPDQYLRVYWNGSGIGAEIIDNPDDVCHPDEICLTATTSMDELTPVSVALDRLAEKLVSE